MKKRNRNIIIAVAVVAVVLVVGVVMYLNFRDNSSKEIAKDSQYTVGFSVHFMQDDYTTSVVNGFEAVMKENGVEAIVTNANGDAKRQVSDIEYLISLGVDAIGVCPLDDSAIRQSLIEAQEQGIIIVTITEIEGVDADAVVYGREYENGYGSGRRLAEALKEEEDAEVVVMDFPYDVARTKERIQGFEDAIEGTGIKVTATGRPGSNEEAMDFIKELLESNPNIKGVFGSYSNQVIGAGAACMALDRDDVVVVGVDADIMILKLLQEGWVDAVTAQFPYEHGEACAQAIINLLNGEKISVIYKTPYQIVDADNAEIMAVRLWGRELE